MELNENSKVENQLSKINVFRNWSIAFCLPIFLLTNNRNSVRKTFVEGCWYRKHLVNIFNAMTMTRFIIISHQQVFLRVSQSGFSSLLSWIRLRHCLLNRLLKMLSSSQSMIDKRLFTFFRFPIDECEGLDEVNLRFSSWRWKADKTVLISFIVNIITLH